MLDFFNLKPEFFALDISNLSLKIAKLKKKRGYLELESFGELKIKKGIISNGEIKEEDDLIEAIKNVVNGVKGKKLKTKYVACSLPEEKSFLEIIKMPLMSREDLKSAILFEVENYIPLPIEDVYLDFEIINKDIRKKEMEVLLAALPKKTVDLYINCLKKAGLKPLFLEIESLAIVRALINKKLSSQSFLLIDLGLTRTGFVVFVDGCIRFTSSIPVSAENFTDIIAKALNISTSRAEDLKIRHGLSGKVKFKIKNKKAIKSVERGRVFEALIPALADLVQQIKVYMKYYQTHANTGADRKIQRILLSGGGANLKGLKELFSIELNAPVEFGDPWMNIAPVKHTERKKLSQSEALAYTTALGLAQKNIEEQND
ncbi:MAG: type IV pilus assembly protein PilM [Patescibacteria group bacterium]